MLFSSITFLYFFLPSVLLIYYFVPSKGKNLILFLFSILFYAWGEPKYVFLMMAQILITYVLTLLVDKYKDSRAGNIYAILSVLTPFAALFYFKYSTFFIESVLRIKVPFVFLEAKDIVLPIGISFYTFQIVSYCIDVKRGTVKCQKNLLALATYVTLFPQLVAGPIVRYSDINDSLNKKLKADYAHFEYGIFRFATGLGKKVLIANLLGEIVTEVSQLQARDLTLSWVYALAVTLQIYFDFSGYSDMAIGLGAMFGFTFPENFRYPIISKSISEFWRRWHITLGSWFRDYIYIPLGGNRVGFIRWIFNILVVWFFTGLWHGANWNFVIWGLYFAIFLMLEKLVSKFINKYCRNITNNNAMLVLDVIRHIYVVCAIIVSFLIFHNTDVHRVMEDVKSLCNVGNLIDISGGSTYLYRHICYNRIGIVVIAVIAATPVPSIICSKIVKRLSLSLIGNVLVNVMRVIYILFVIVMSTAYIIDGSFNPFLYFRF